MEQLAKVVSGLSLVYGPPNSLPDKSCPELRFGPLTMLEESTPEALISFIRHQQHFLADNVLSLIKGLRPLDTPVATPDGSSTTIQTLLSTLQADGKPFICSG